MISISTDTPLFAKLMVAAVYFVVGPDHVVQGIEAVKFATLMVCAINAIWLTMDSACWALNKLAKAD